MDWWWPAAGLEALSVAVNAWDVLKEVTLSSLPPPEFGPQVNNREGTQLHPSAGHWIEDLLSTAETYQNQTQFSPQSVSPIRKLP